MQPVLTALADAKQCNGKETISEVVQLKAKFCYLQ
jgi:hypothetical protein